MAATSRTEDGHLRPFRPRGFHPRVLGDPRAHGPGQDQGDAYRGPLEFGPEGLGEEHHRRLRGPVKGLPRHGHEGPHAGDVHQVGLGALEEPGQKSPGHVEGTPEVHPHHALHGRLVQVQEALKGLDDPGVVDEAVHLAVDPFHLLGQGGHLLLVGDVQGWRLKPSPRLPALAMVSWRPSDLRSTAATLAPRLKSSKARAWPRPLPAPVTTTTFPARRMASVYATLPPQGLEGRPSAHPLCLSRSLGGSTPTSLPRAKASPGSSPGEGEDLPPRGLCPLKEHLPDGLGEGEVARHALRMPRMEALFNTVVPVALVVLSGYLLGRRLEMDLSTLSRLTLYALVPALILDSMYRAEYTLEGVWGLVLGFSLTYALLFLLVQGAGKLFGLSRETTKTLLVCGLFPNSGNMGLSLVYFALGEEGLRRAVVYFLLSSALMFGLGPAFIRGGGLKEGLLFTLRLPSSTPSSWASSSRPWA